MKNSTPTLSPIKVIKLKGALKGARQSEIRSAFLESKNYSIIAVDLSETTSVDIPFLNLLVSLKNENSETAARIKLINPVPEVSKILRLYHLDMAFEMIETVKPGGL